MCSSTEKVQYNIKCNSLYIFSLCISLSLETGFSECFLLSMRQWLLIDPDNLVSYLIGHCGWIWLKMEWIKNKRERVKRYRHEKEKRKTFFCFPHFPLPLFSFVNCPLITISILPNLLLCLRDQRYWVLTRPNYTIVQQVSKWRLTNGDCVARDYHVPRVRRKRARNVYI